VEVYLHSPILLMAWYLSTGYVFFTAWYLCKQRASLIFIFALPVYGSSRIVRIVKRRRLRGAGYVGLMGETKNAYKYLVR
jgi:hypothetical protein